MLALIDSKGFHASTRKILTDEGITLSNSRFCGSAFELKILRKIQLRFSYVYVWNDGKISRHYKNGDSEWVSKSDLPSLIKKEVSNGN